MHVTRPKSSKGRSRPALNHTKSADFSGYHECPVNPRPPSERAACSSHPARAFLRQSSAITAQEATALLQEALAPPILSLNRYRVLPSIEGRGSDDPEPFRGLEEKTSKLRLSDDQMVSSHRGDPGQHLSKCPALRSNPEIYGVLGHRAPKLPNLRVEVESEAAEAEGQGMVPSADQLGLLLAVRSPRGRRLQRRFLPTDTLRTVLAVTEDAHGVRYGRAVIQTMEVPRRSFADLTVTLAQCGIQNRSVLCISKEDDGSNDST